MEYVLIVSFALLVGFCLGAPVMVLLESSDAAGSAGNVRLPIHEVSPSRQ